MGSARVRAEAIAVLFTFVVIMMLSGVPVSATAGIGFPVRTQAIVRPTLVSIVTGPTQAADACGAWTIPSFIIAGTANNKLLVVMVTAQSAFASDVTVQYGGQSLILTNESGTFPRFIEVWTEMNVQAHAADTIYVNTTTAGKLNTGVVAVFSGVDITATPQTVGNFGFGTVTNPLLNQAKSNDLIFSAALTRSGGQFIDPYADLTGATVAVNQTYINTGPTCANSNTMYAMTGAIATAAAGSPIGWVFQNDALGFATMSIDIRGLVSAPPSGGHPPSSTPIPVNNIPPCTTAGLEGSGISLVQEGATPFSALTAPSSSGPTTFQLQDNRPDAAVTALTNVDWGDGNQTTVTGLPVASHTYVSGGVYQVRVVEQSTLGEVTQFSGVADTMGTCSINALITLAMPGILATAVVAVMAMVIQKFTGKQRVKNSRLLLIAIIAGGFVIVMLAIGLPLITPWWRFG